MIPTATSVGNRLRGKTVFLSASVPVPKRAEQYHRIEGAHFEIEQAVISLARAVFAESGGLVFGGHPAISPLVAMVAGEYREPRFAESREEKPAAPIRIFQSRAFEGFLPSDTLLMYQLGYATITWIDALDGEKFDPTIEYRQPPCPKSLDAMREAMILWTNPEAMVCIGGMEGVEREFEMFRQLRSNGSVYTLERTGGAASLLARHHSGHVRVIDSEVINKVDELRTKHFPHEDISPKREEQRSVPYPLIMQTIVEEIAENDFRRVRRR
jgi:hypothetical protein